MTDGGTGLLVVSLLGGLLSLDRTAFLQTMVSRPLAASALVGAVAGEPALGLLCGLLLEFLWLMDLPVGSAVPPDEVLAGVVSAFLAVEAPAEWSSLARATLGVLVAIPLAFAGRGADLAVRRWNGNLVARARARILEGGGGIGGLHFAGAGCFFVAGAAASGGAAWAGTWSLAAAAPLLPAGTPTVLELVGMALPVLGIAAVLAGLGGRRYGVLFGIGLLGGFVLFHPPSLLRLLRSLGTVRWRP